MSVARIMSLVMLWNVSVGDITYCRMNKSDDSLNAEQLGEFTVSFLRRFQWGNAIILTSKRGGGLHKYFSTNYIRVAVHPLTTNLSNVNHFRSVILIDGQQTAFDVLTRVLANPRPPSPHNWLLITNGEFIEKSLPFIPHDYKVIFAVPARPKLFRLYSINTREYKTKTLGYWGTDENILRVTFVPIPLPLLSGTVIRIATTELLPHFGNESLQSARGDSPRGIFGEILHVLRIKMNFTYTVTPPKDRKFGNRINDTYSTGMVGQLGANERDMSIAITMSSDRKTVIDYSHMVTKIYVKFVYRNRESARWRFFFFREPFSYGLWVSIIGIGTIVAILFSLVNENNDINRHRSSNHRRNFSRFKTFTWYVEVSFFTLLRTGFDLKVSRAANKIVLQVFHFFSIIIFVQYSTVLTSMLTVNNVPIPFRSLKELLDKSDYALGTLHGTSIVEVYNFSNSGLNERVWKRMQKDPNRYITSTTQRGLDLAYAEKYAFIMESLVLATLMKGNCSLQFGEEKAYDIVFCVGYRRGFRFKKTFDKYLQLMVENGVVRKIEHKYTPPNHNRACESKARQMGLERHSLVGIFVVMSLAILLSLFTLTLEILLNRT